MYCASFVVGVAVIVLDQIVSVIQFVEILVPYGTVTDDSLTVPEFVSFDVILTVWLFTVDSKFAVNVHAFVTVSHPQSSVQSLNIYVY